MWVDGDPVGRLRVLRTKEQIELAGIQLLPRVQGLGIGTLLVESLKLEAAEVGVPLTLGVERNNSAARRLYTRLGFVDFGETEREFLMAWHPPCE